LVRKFVPSIFVKWLGLWREVWQNFQQSRNSELCERIQEIGNRIAVCCHAGMQAKRSRHASGVYTG
jgi:hypothetical protein